MIWDEQTDLGEYGTMSIETTSLKGKYMTEVYDVVCAYPDGVTANEIQRHVPGISSSKTGGVLRRLKDLKLVRSEHLDSSNIHIWFKT